MHVLICILLIDVCCLYHIAKLFISLNNGGNDQNDAEEEEEEAKLGCPRKSSSHPSPFFLFGFLGEELVRLSEPDELEVAEQASNTLLNAGHANSQLSIASFF